MYIHTYRGDSFELDDGEERRPLLWHNDHSSDNTIYNDYRSAAGTQTQT